MKAQLASVIGSSEGETSLFIKFCILSNFSLSSSAYGKGGGRAASKGLIIPCTRNEALVATNKSAFSMGLRRSRAVEEDKIEEKDTGQQHASSNNATPTRNPPIMKSLGKHGN